MNKEEPAVKLENVSFSYPEGKRQVFTNLDIELPGGLISFVGKNGIGKSTLLLLAGARIQPISGTVKIFGADTKSFGDEERNRAVSYVYQNMEFESDDNVGDLINFVYNNGFLIDKDPEFIRDLIQLFELKNILAKKTHNISKGELQRTIIIFSILYGSKILMMDEPIFALEDKQKERIMEFLAEYSRKQQISVYYSVHELNLSRKYSDSVLLFRKNQEFSFGRPEEVLTETSLEDAFSIPYAMLYEKEQLFRKHLLEADEQLSEK